MRSILKALALVALGYLLCVYFQYDLNVNYRTVFQSPESAQQREFTLRLQPYHDMKPINLFEPLEEK